MRPGSPNGAAPYYGYPQGQTIKPGGHRGGRVVIWHGLTIAAFIVAAAALALALAVMRQNSDTTTDLRRHRNAHADAHGHPDPKLDRRQVNLAPPRATGERRGARRYEAPAERYAPRPTDEEPPTDPGLEPPPEQPPGEDTGELEQHDLPTTAIPAMPPLRRPQP